MNEEPRSLLPVMAAAAIQFASLGMAGLFGYALLVGNTLIVKYVVISALLSYVAQVALTVMEQARVLGRPMPRVRLASCIAYGAYTGAVMFCLSAVLVMLFA